MIPLPTDPIRKEHLELLPHIHEMEQAAVEVTGWNHEVASDRLHQIVHFLEGHLLPHAVAEEEILYPAIDEAMGAPNATGTMRIDHDEIATRVRRLRHTTSAALDTWPDQERIAGIVRGLSALAAIVLLHFRKEEEVLLAVLDSVLTVEEAQALLESMDPDHPNHP